jgi:8-oxo-dGTP pyrophosphatase MutT (NUDIX family)
MGFNFRKFALEQDNTGPAEAVLPNKEQPASCSYCGANDFTDLTDNGKVRQATCTACGGTMSAHDGAQWTPELIGDPSNHPKPDADPRSGGVGGAGATVYDPLARPNNDRISKLTDPETHALLTRFGHDHRTGEQHFSRLHTLTPVKHAGFAGYVEGYEGQHEFHKEEDRALYGSRHPEGGFDENLWDDTAPDPNTYERGHYEDYDDYPSGYHERHGEAYEKAKQDKENDIKPVAHHEGLYHMLSNHNENDYQDWRDRGEVRNVDLSKHHVYATQPYVVDKHVNRYVQNPGDDVQHVKEHGVTEVGQSYPGTHHPMFVKHENNLFAVEGHHRTASALLRKEPVQALVYDADKHGFPHYDEDTGYDVHGTLQKHGARYGMATDCDFPDHDRDHAIRHHDDGVCTLTEMSRDAGTSRTAASDGPDWCTWRRMAQCTFPNDRNNTLLAVPQNRGACPWTTRWEQQVCPISEPGPQALMSAKGSKMDGQLSSKLAMPSRNHPEPPTGVDFTTYNAVGPGNDHPVWEGRADPWHEEGEETHPGWSHHLFKIHNGPHQGPNHGSGVAGTIYYSKTKPGDPAHPALAIHDMKVYDEESRGKGYGSAMQDELRRQHPTHMFDHGGRSPAGQKWWNSYQDPGDPKLDLDHPDNADKKDLYRPTQLQRNLAESTFYRASLRHESAIPAGPCPECEGNGHYDIEEENPDYQEKPGVHPEEDPDAYRMRRETCEACGGSGHADAVSDEELARQHEENRQFLKSQIREHLETTDHPDGVKTKYCTDRYCPYPSPPRAPKQQKPQETPEERQERRQKAMDDYARRGRSQRPQIAPEAAALMLRTARKDEEFRFQVVASWTDVRNKAKRIRREGKVNIKVATTEGLAGEVQGDHGAYQNYITYRPGTFKIADWSCDCKWGDWAWDRLRFHGRQCSHSLALMYEAQSRGMFGREIKLGALVFGEAHEPDEVPGISDSPLSTIASAMLDNDDDPADVMKILMAYGLTHSAALQMVAEEEDEEHRRKCPYCGGTLTEEAIEKHKCSHCGHAIGFIGSVIDDERRKHHKTNDTRRHAPDFGYGIPSWIGLPLTNCPQCAGWGCGHCGGTGQVAEDGQGHTADPVSDQNPDMGPMMSGGISDTSSLHTGGLDDEMGLVDVDELGPVLAAKKDGPTVSGVALKAADTGRILMLQRGLDDEKDPARGTWELPGGHHEEGDTTSLHAAVREWEEEVGQKFPEGGVVHHTWTSPNGVYQGHVVVIPSEKDLSMKDGRVIPNPDDPKGDCHEQAAWWDIDHAKKNPALRKEMKSAPWNEIAKAGEQKTAAHDSWSPLQGEDDQPGFPYAAPLHSNSQNPGSTGFATSEDPKSWNNEDEVPTNLLSSDSYDSMGYYGTLHEEPEPALPSTDGGAEDPVPDNPIAQYQPPETASSIDADEGSATPNQFTGSVGDIVASFQATAAAQGIMTGATPAKQEGNDVSFDFTASARAYLAQDKGLQKSALRDFDFAEQQDLINEGARDGARARNFGDLKIEGTHYEALSKALGMDSEDPEELFM